VRRARWVLQENDPCLVLAAIVKGTRVQIQRLAAFATVADHVPCRRDAFATRDAKGWVARHRFFGWWLVGIAERQGLRLTPPEGLLVDVAAPSPVFCRAIVIVKFDDDVMAGPIAESDGPGCGLGGFGGGAGAGGQVFVGVLGSDCIPEACQGENRQDSPHQLQFDLQQFAP